ncbi:MAG: hypothetical protein ACKOEX_09600, partial [Planctomycetia bacterium]
MNPHFVEIPRAFRDEAVEYGPADRLSARDRVRRAQARTMSPAERLAAMRRLLAQSRKILECSPAGLA